MGAGLCPSRRDSDNPSSEAASFLSIAPRRSLGLPLLSFVSFSFSFLVACRKRLCCKDNQEKRRASQPPASMASVGTLSLFFPVFLPAAGATGLYFAHRALYVDWGAYAKHFFMGPGSVSRVLLAVFVLGNLKSIPFAWTVCHAFPSSIRL